MVHYIKPDWLEDICRPDCPNNLAPLLVEVLATVLDNEVIFKIDFVYIIFYIFSIFLNIDMYLQSFKLFFDKSKQFYFIDFILFRKLKCFYFAKLTLFQDKTWLYYCDMSGESQKYLPRKLYKMLIVKKNYKSLMVK